MKFLLNEFKTFSNVYNSAQYSKASNKASKLLFFFFESKVKTKNKNQKNCRQGLDLIIR